jgi:replicative superfamily II helicase
VRWEALVTAIAAAGYDSIGENYRAKRPYNKLALISHPIPVSDIFYQSPEMARLFTKAIAHYGLRDLRSLNSDLEVALEFSRNAEKKAPDATTPDDRLEMLSLMVLLRDYAIAHQGENPDLSKIGTRAQTLEDAMYEMDVSPWLSLLAILLSRSIGSSLKRSIIPLPIPSYIKRGLVEQKIVELWPPQLEATQKGLFSGGSIVYAAPPASGKTLLSLLASAKSTPDHKTVYLVPTRTLAEETFAQLKKNIGSDALQVGISTRDRTEFDDSLNGISVLVTTYEKFTPLIKKDRVYETQISRLLIDEVQKLSDEGRGIPLEFILTRSRTRGASEDPQVVAISGIVRKDDAEQLSNWLSSGLVCSEWKPVDLDETILCEGELHHRDGRVENIGFGSNKRLGSRAQRIQLAILLSRRAVVSRGQCLVAIESRRRVEEFAELLKDFFHSANFDIDLRNEIAESRTERERFYQEITGLEPQLSSGYVKLAELLQHGIAYHHAGMPSALREIVEKAVRERVVRVLVSTTTFEAGVNLPVSHVIFPFASGGGPSMKVATYRNLSGRAGRPGFDIRGQSTIITLTKDEMKNARERFFDGQPEALESAVRFFLRKRPPSRYAIQAQILSLAKSDGTLGEDDISSLMSRTWFWHGAPEEKKALFQDGVRTETEKLHKYGFLQTLSRGKFTITSRGKIATRSSLSPFSTKLLMDNFAKILRARYSGDEFDLLVLGLVALPFELEESDEYLEKVPIPQDLEFLSKVLTFDPSVREVYQRVEKSPQYAAILRKWVDGLPIDEILSLSGLDPSTDASLLEGTLPNDAFWVISSLSDMPGTILGATAEQRTRVQELAEFCKFGTKDPIAINLLKIGFKHLGRETALKLSFYLHKSGTTLKDLKRDELTAIFPGRTDACNSLYNEIQAYLKK